MINKIIIGMSQALNQEFGDDFNIYAESIEQNLDTPCFLITNIVHTHDAKLSNRYQNNNSFMVQYFPKSDTDSLNEINNVVSRLEDSLEWITVDGSKVRGTNMESNTSDNVLNFQIDYNVRTVRKSEDVERMNNLKYKGVV
ncbi:phage tail terminator family protein [Anaerosporobacter sp.]